MNPTNWTLSSYTNDAWTTPRDSQGKLLSAPAKIRALIIANTTGAAITVDARISSGASAERAIIIPSASIEAGEANVVDLCGLNLGRGDQLQFRCSATGINITASGEA